MFIVTGASNSHFRSLCQFLRSLPTDQLSCTYVWNLGLTVENLDFLHTSFSAAQIRHFPFAEYPAYFNIEVAAGEYA